jgi:hypothetical protein
MAQITAAPFVLKDARFLVAADSYESAVSSVQFVPSASTVQFQGITPAASYTNVTTATWVATITFSQDFSTTNSLSQYLLANEGKSVVVKFVPITAATGTVPTFTATVFITPGSIGGDVNAVQTATVTLPVVGKPALTVAAPPA